MSDTEQPPAGSRCWDSDTTQAYFGKRMAAGSAEALLQGDMQDPASPGYGAASQAKASGSKHVAASSFLVSYTRRLLAWKYLVIGIWVVAAVAALPFGAMVMLQLPFRMDPGKRTQSGRAFQTMQAEFPGKTFLDYEVVLVTCDGCRNVLDEPFARKALKELATRMEELKGQDEEAVSGWDRANQAADMAFRMAAISKALGAPPQSNPYVSADGRTVLFHTTWQYPVGMEKRTLKQLHKLQHLVEEIDKRGRSSGFRVLIFGALSLTNTMSAVMLKEVFLKEMIMAPLAMLVILWQVWSFRLTGLAGAVMGVTMAVSIGLLYPVKFAVFFTPVCPMMVAVLCIAICVDYCLFTFVRFREEIQAGRSPEEAIEVSMDSSGRAIALSGSVLCVTFGLCILYPGEAVWCMALAGTIAGVVIVAANLSLTPCALAAAPSFFAYGLKSDTGGNPRGSKVWFRLGAFMIRGWRPVVTMIMLYGCMIPVIWQLARYEPSISLELETPSGHLAWDALQQAKHSFHAGHMMPISLLIKGMQGNIRSEATFAEGCWRMRQLVEATKGTAFAVTPADFISPFSVPGPFVGLLNHLPHGNCPPLTCLRWDESPPECPILPSAKQLLAGGSSLNAIIPGIDSYYRQLWTDQVSGGNNTAITRLATTFLQSGKVMPPFYDALKETSPDGFFGQMPAVHELNMDAVGRIPLVLGLALLAQSIFIAVTFGAYLAPLKLILTVALPIAFTFGILICVYQQGALSWMHLVTVEPMGVYWVVPVVTSAVLLSLAVDYDIFLFTRVYELREAGYDNAAAVAGGLATTGPTITTAGLVMALAFGGMLLSSVCMNREFGFVLAVGVLLDTFVIRGFLVPCVLSVAGASNYWPRKMPEPTRTLADMEEYLTEVEGAGKALSCSGSSGRCAHSLA